MPLYHYKGLNSKGKQTTGVVDADNPRDLKEQLRRDGVFISEYVETTRGGEKRKVGGEKQGSEDFDLGSLLTRISIMEVAEITRQLSTLARAGIPVVEAIAAISEQLENKKLKAVMSRVKRDVSEGASLASALREHPKVFGDLYVNMVHAGESSGNLDVVFDRLADFTESQVRLRAKLMGALMYPIIMAGLGMVIVSLMMLFVVPKISEMFDEMGAELPLITRILIGSSNFAQTFWPLILLGGIVGVGAFARWRRSEDGKPKWDRFVLRVPVFGPLIRMLNIARFARTLSTLLASGVPILSAMTICRSVLTNNVLGDAVDEAREAVKEGQSIADPLKRSGQFPAMVTHMVAVGEKSGELEGMLGNVADSYEIQVDSKITQLTSVMEPVVIVIMGISVAFLVFAILMPMMQMNEVIANGGAG
ncbi:MAG: type II secretion system inner membrane protein GspF [Deltaproteobacteria bacterium]|nr:type II secretion system inner membrane protein GspF [Deltaproteobacteria bacterium]MCB9785186.1 type II secretion system inner membrane protein GspF [Deltaproteobacteria bacterium]